MIDYGPFEFASARHTGADWFCLAMQCCGFPRFRSHEARAPFPDRDSSKLRVSMVRHPVAWLGELFLVDGTACCLEEFVEEHRAMPSVEMVSAYEADSFIRWEDLPEAFLELAWSVGVRERCFDHALFRRVPASSPPIPLHPNVRRRVMEANREMVERFDYW